MNKTIDTTFEDMMAALSKKSTAVSASGKIGFKAQGTSEKEKVKAALQGALAKQEAEKKDTTVPDIFLGNKKYNVPTATITDSSPKIDTSFEKSMAELAEKQGVQTPVMTRPTRPTGSTAEESAVSTALKGAVEEENKYKSEAASVNEQLEQLDRELITLRNNKGFYKVNPVQAGLYGADVTLIEKRIEEINTEKQALLAKQKELDRTYAEQVAANKHISDSENKLPIFKVSERDKMKTLAYYLDNPNDTSAASRPLSGASGADNMMSEAQKKYYAENSVSLSGTEDEYALYDTIRYMTEAQKKTLGYYASIGDYDMMSRYYNSIKGGLYKSRAEAQKEYIADLSDKSPASALAARLALGVTRPISAAKTLIKGLSGKEIDSNSPDYDYNRASTVAENTLLGNIDNGFARFLASTGISIADNIINRVVFGPLALVAMSSSAASDAAYNALEDGATNEQALSIGLTYGAVEFLTEKISFDGLNKLVKEAGIGGAKNLTKQLLKQIVSEGGEELIAEYADNLLDIAIRGNESEYNKAITDMVSSGMTTDEATKKAITEYFIKNPLVSFAGGAISGGVMGAGGALYGNIKGNQYKADTDTLYRTAKENGVSQARADETARISDYIHTNVQFYRNDEAKNTEHGYYTDGTVYINAASSTPVAQTIAHELTHSVEATKAYKDLLTGIENYMAKTGIDIKAEAEDVKKIYKASSRNITLDDAGARAEVVAKFIEKNLLNKDAGIYELATVNTPLFRRLHGYLSRVFAKATPADRELNSIKSRFERALAQVQAGTSPAAENNNKIKATLPEWYKKYRAGNMADINNSIKINNIDTQSGYNDTQSGYNDTQSGYNDTQSGYNDTKNDNDKYSITPSTITETDEIRAPRISPGMSDSERERILNNKTIAAPKYEGQADTIIGDNKIALNSHKKSLVQSAIKKIAEEFSLFENGVEKYNIEDIKVEVSFSGGSLGESTQKSIASGELLSKLLPMLETAVEGSVAIECHDNRYYADNNTKLFYELIGGYIDGEYFIPVRFGAKLFADDTSTLYIVVCQDKIEKTKVLGLRATALPGAHKPLLVFNISVPLILKNVNSNDLLRYIPDGFLSTTQKADKYKGIAETIKYTNDKNDKAYREAIERGNNRQVTRMVQTAAIKWGTCTENGKPIDFYHQTSEEFNTFENGRAYAGANDSETPDGYFFKTNDHDIGLDGKIQMHVYLKADKVLKFSDRKSANKWYCENIDGYKSLQDKMNNAIEPVDRKLKSVETTMYTDNVTDEEFDKYSDEWDRLLEEMRVIENSYRGKLRDILNKYFLEGNSNYDAIELYYDGHRYINGIRENVHTFIVFKNTQIKSADPITYDDNGKVIPISERFKDNKSDKRYSITADNSEETEASPKYDDDDYVPVTMPKIILKNDTNITIKKQEPKQETTSDKPRVPYAVIKNNDKISDANKASIEKFARIEAAQTGVSVDVAADRLIKDFETDKHVSVNSDAVAGKLIIHLANLLYDASGNVQDDGYDVNNGLSRKAQELLKKATNRIKKHLRENINDGDERVEAVIDKVIMMYMRYGDLNKKAVDDMYSEFREDNKTDESRESFERAVSDFLRVLKEVKAVAESQMDTDTKVEKMLEEEKSAILKYLKEAYKVVNGIQKKIAKNEKYNLYTERDRALIDRLANNEIKLSEIEGQENSKNIIDRAELESELLQAEKPIRRYNAKFREMLKSDAESMLENSDSWKVHKSGLYYNLAFPQRLVNAMIAEPEERERFWNYYYDRVQKNEAKKGKYVGELRDRIRALKISQKISKGNQDSEAAAVQFIGEAKDALDYFSKGYHPKGKYEGLTLSEWMKKIEGFRADNPDIDYSSLSAEDSEFIKKAKSAMRYFEGRTWMTGEVHNGYTYTEWLNRYEEFKNNNPKLDYERIDTIVKEMRKIYDDLFDKLNDARMANGYAPIRYRKGYFPHFSSADDNKAARIKEIKVRLKKIKPTTNVQVGNKNSEAEAIVLLGTEADAEAFFAVFPGGKYEGKTVGEFEEYIKTFKKNNPQIDFDKLKVKQKEIEILSKELSEISDNAYGDTVLSDLTRVFGVELAATELPTSISGITHTFKPGKRWTPNELRRMGNKTSYNVLEGFEKYINGISDVIYHTEDIQRFRALEREIRERSAPEEIKKRIKEYEENESLSDSERKTLIDKALDDAEYKLKGFVKYVKNYADTLANKRTYLDRYLEEELPWAHRVLVGLRNKAALNMVSANLSTALTNIVPLAQASPELNKIAMFKAAIDFVKSIKTDDGFTARSTFLSNRSSQTPLNDSGMRKAVNISMMPMELIDKLVSNVIVRSRYADNIKKGMTDSAAMQDADLFAASVMADRSKGMRPLIYNIKTPIISLFTQFQIETQNQLEHFFIDVPRRKKDKAIGQIIWIMFQYLIYSYVLGDLYEAVVGRRVLFDPVGLANDAIGDYTGYSLPNMFSALYSALFGGKKITFKNDKQSTANANAALVKNLAEELPFIGSVLGGGRIPISSTFPDVSKLNNTLGGDGTVKSKIINAGKEIAKPVIYLVMPFGGSQIKKMAEGAAAYLKSGEYGIDSTGAEELKYPVEQNIGSALKIAAFGKSSLGNAVDYYDSGETKLTADYTASYKSMIKSGIKASSAYNIVKSIRNAGSRSSKVAVIDNSGLNDKQKLDLYKDLIVPDDSDELATIKALSERDYSRAYETIQDIRESNHVWEQLNALSESNVSESGKIIIFNKLLYPDNADKRKQMQEVIDTGVNMSEYLYVLASAGQATSDKDREGNTISGSKKEKVLNIIDNMELTAKQKDALYYACGYSDNTITDVPWHKSTKITFKDLPKKSDTIIRFKIR